MTLLSIRDIDVAFGGLRALSKVSFDVRRGAIHGLIGPNGAGKTTLMNVISGLIRPQDGEVDLNGKRLPSRASSLRALGLSRTFQAPVVFPELTVLENVMFGAMSSTSAGLFSSIVGFPEARREELRSRHEALELLDLVHFEGSPQQSGRTLSFGNERKVEVARALMCDPSLLLMDEPTAGFTRQEVETFAGLLRTIQSRSAGDLTILLVEHNVPFIFGLCDRVTALDDGVVVGDGTAAEVRRDPVVIRSYIGDSETEKTQPGTMAATNPRPRRPTSIGEEGLQISGLCAGYGSALALHEVSLSVGPSEVVALLGRNGAGKSTLLNSIMHTVRPSAGSITWNGTRIDRLGTDRIIDRGIALVPQGRAVIQRQSVEDNLRLAGRGALRGSAMDERIAEVFEIFPRLVERRSQLAGRLSGGERQMLAIGKALMRRPEILLLDEPSIGLAVQVVRELQAFVARINASGTPVVIAEQNVGWVLPLADHAYVLDSGSIAHEGPVDSLSDAGALSAQFLGA